MKNTLYSVMLLAIVLFPACKKELLEADPTKIILGKWELIEYELLGKMQSVENSAGFFYEFQADSVLLYFDYEKNQYTQQYKYWFSDSLLNIGGNYIYTFYDKNSKLRLDDRFSTAWIQVYIYKRKN